MRFALGVATGLVVSILLTACARPSDRSAPKIGPRQAQPTAEQGAQAGEPGTGAQSGSGGQPGKDTAPANGKELAAVQVEQRGGHDWRPITLLEASAPPGPSEVRLTFTKPVRQQEVERALASTQPAPVRGLMQWLDDQTLIWSIPNLPARLDFLLGEAHDTDGLPLPGGLPSLRVGEAPVLVALDLTTRKEQTIARLPADVWTAVLTPDGTEANLQVWLPGATRWDWQLTDLRLDLRTGKLASGAAGGEIPRLRAELENWVLSPQGGLGVGARHGDLILADSRGGRQQVFPGVITRYTWAHGEMPVDLVWSADGKRVAALSVKSKEPPVQDLVAVALPSGERSVLMPDLPLGRSSPRLAWSPDDRFMLVGNLLADLQAKRVTALAGHIDEARGVWAPDGARLLYTTKDWAPVLLLDPATQASDDLGTAMIVGWAGPDTIYLIRWSASSTRYAPAGQ